MTRYALDENGIPQPLPEVDDSVTLEITKDILSQISRPDLHGREGLVHVHRILKARFPQHIEEMSEDRVKAALERARYHFIDAATATFDGHFYERVFVLAIIDVFSAAKVRARFPHFDQYPLPRWHVSIHDRKPAEK